MAQQLRQWWQSAVVYQIYPRSFADGNGDGVGDLAGIAAHLDYLVELGVDVIWLSPIYPSPQADNGYDISNYQDIDPVFGSLSEFDALLREIHRRGMKLIMDLVVNHTSDEHPWFIESRSSSDNPKRDWYWWRPACEGMQAGTPGAEPTDWESYFSGSAWQFDETTGQYYLHIFSRKQPDLNWENPELRQAIYAMMRWWLDRGIDGFRMDALNLISKDPVLLGGQVLSGGLWDYICGPRFHKFLQEMHREVFAGRPGQFLTVGEVPGITVDDARLCTDAARAELDMIYHFEHVLLGSGNGGKWDIVPFDLTDLKAVFGHWQAGLAEVGWNNLYWSNHDQPRAVSRFGDDGEYRVQAAKLLGTVLHLHRGTPCVYQGEELGMTNFPFSSIEDFRDIESLNYYSQAIASGRNPADVLAALCLRSRDNGRTPMQWDDSPHAGFTVGEPWIRVNPNYNIINARAERAEPDSVLQHYRKLIALRHDLPVVAFGDFTMLLPQDPQIYAFTRRLEEVELLVIANFSQEIVDAALPNADDWAASEELLTNYSQTSSEGLLRLRPWEARVFRRTVPTNEHSLSRPQ